MARRTRANFTDRFPGQVTFTGSPPEDLDLPVANEIRFDETGAAPVSAALLNTIILERLDRVEAILAGKRKARDEGIIDER